MAEMSQLLFMQTRIARLASERWNMPIEKIAGIFKQYNVFDYIENGFGIFHCEGDEAVFDDVEEYLDRKGFEHNDNT